MSVTWPERRLKTVAGVRLSNVDKKSVEGEESVRLCNYTDVYNNERITDEMDFMVATAPDRQVRAFALQPGDVLITKDSESWDDIAVPAVVVDQVDAICGYHLALLRPHSEKLDGRFLLYALKSARTATHFKIQANGVTRFSVGERAIGDAPIPLPPRTVQGAIADFLDSESARIRALNSRKQLFIDLLLEKRTALITDAVTKGLDSDAEMTDSGVPWLGLIPKHWEAMAFRRHCRIARGQVNPTLEPYADMVLIAPDHVESKTGRILALETARDQSATSGKYEAFPGQVIYSKIRPALAKACLAREHWLCSADMYPVSVDRRLDAEYLLYWMLSHPFTALTTLESMRVAMPKVNRETLGASPMPVPPFDEQRRIVEYLDGELREVDELIEMTRRSIDLLNEHRTAMISGVVMGEIETPE